MIDEIEIRTKSRPMPLQLLGRVVETLKVLLVRVYLQAAAQQNGVTADRDTTGSAKAQGGGGGGSKKGKRSFFLQFLLRSINSVLGDLSERHARQPLFDALVGSGA